MRTGLIAAIVSTNALAQPDPSGIEFVTVGAPGNPAYAGPDNNNLVTGRGSVPYEFRIGRTEVTTAQWVEFYNAFYGRVPSINLPARWGAYQTGNPQSRFGVLSAPGAGMWPVSGVTWRTSAMFCNWLHNDKRTDLAAIQNGAYDTSTFGYEAPPRDNVFTDQLAHHPDARYWIPTVDEWLKGVYYDPNHGGTGIGGWWWNSVNGSNTPLIYGPPGQGQANAGFQPDDNSHYRIPLMAYTGVESPWGMMDAAGGTRELLESVYQPDAFPYRFVAGSHWGPWRGGDAIYSLGTTFPSTPSLFYGFRIAAAVPSSGPFAVMMLVGAHIVLRRGRAPGDSHETGSVARGPGGPGWRRRFGERC